VIYTDQKLSRLLAPHMQRVLVIDPVPSGARLLGELMKDLGARNIYSETTDVRALSAVKAIEPQLIFTELKGPNLDGLDFVRRLRRSDMASRQAPVIIVTAEATAGAIVAARDAGAHEFLRKPYTIKDLLRRLEAVSLRSRDWIEAVHYVGPDRRRFNSGDYQGPRKRQTDNPPTPDAARITQALKILKAAIPAIDTDPVQALRAMQAQAAELHKTAMTTCDMKLSDAASNLQRLLNQAVASGIMVRADIEACAAPLWTFMPAEAPKAEVAKTAA